MIATARSPQFVELKCHVPSTHDNTWMFTKACFIPSKYTGIKIKALPSLCHLKSGYSTFCLCNTCTQCASSSIMARYAT